MQTIFFTLAIEGADQRTLYLANPIGAPSWTFNPSEAIRYDAISEAEYRLSKINEHDPQPQTMAVVRVTMTIVTEAV